MRALCLKNTKMKEHPKSKETETETRRHKMTKQRQTKWRKENRNLHQAKTFV